MELEHPEHLNPFILLGIVNEKLRLTCNSLDQLADEMDMSKQEIENQLHKIRFHYQPVNNQFVQD
ncbi:DUF4250 domain-containing protein [Endozoicomonas atrinae]|uniref:DUF4250 domain-containing protein n=1 Tax=Endozoicomonas atrinae TaxID=1333660 RepID=UPI000825E9D9|nr:DUF4250 domain-containing protein [Endozoicomonas atrinae]